MEKLNSKILEKNCLTLITNILEGIEKATEELKKLVNTLWDLRTIIHHEFMNYNLLFNLHLYFEKGVERDLRIYTETYNLYINIKDKKIKVEKHKGDNLIIAYIHLNDKVSDELLDFIYESFHDQSRELNLKLLEYETYTTEIVDCSGV